jgi:hypothetical protein
MLEDVLHHKAQAHAQSSGNPDKITVGSANHMTLYIHVYMMRLALAALPYVFEYNTATQQGAASQKDALHTSILARLLVT